MAIWDSTELLRDKKRPIRDPKGRTLSCQLDKDENSKLTVGNAAFIATLIQISEKTNSGDYKDGRRNSSPYYPVWPYEKAFRSTWFVSDQFTMKNFIVQSICSIRRSHTPKQLFQNIAHETISFETEGKKLVSKFNTACLQTFNGRKQQFCKFVFRLLGYKAFFAPRWRNSNFEKESLRLKQTKDALPKLFRTTANDQRDGSWWRISSFKKLYSERHEESVRSFHLFQPVDQLFFTENACLAFQKFWKIGVRFFEEIRILTLVHLDAIINDAVNNLAKWVFNMEQIINWKNKNPEVPKHVSGYRNIVKNSRIKTNEGCIPQVSAEKLKALLLLASLQLFQRCRNFLVESYCGSQMCTSKELSSIVADIFNVRIDNTFKKTLISQYPGIEHFCVILKVGIFVGLICAWMGAVQDCYTLHAPSIAASTGAFPSYGALDLVRDSDKNDSIHS